MAKVVLNMKHKTNGLKREFVEDTFLDMFYKVHHLDYITEEFLQLALEEYFLNKPIDENTDIYEYINNLSDDQLASLIVGEFNDDYHVTVKLKNLYVSSLYIQEEGEQEWNDFEQCDNECYFETDEQAIDYYLYQDDWDITHTDPPFTYTISRIEDGEFITIYELKR